MKYLNKMLLLSTATLTITIFANSLSSQVNQEWVQTYNGPEVAADAGYSIAVDALGNVYVTGRSQGSTLDFEYATIKYNSAGVELWAQRYIGPGNSYDPISLAVDGSGNVYVTGSSGIGKSSNYATVKYNSSGVEQWVQIYNSPEGGSDNAYSIAVDGSGNVYVTGSSIDTETGYNYATIKYNSFGVEQWVQRNIGPGNSYDVARSITVDGSGNVYVTGTTATIKYNSSGVEQWIQRYDGLYARSIAVDGSGNVYITGQNYNILTGNDYATIKFNSSGKEQWLQTYNTPTPYLFLHDVANSIAINGSGNVYVTGASAGSGLDFDYATIKYNSSGVEQWVQRYGGENYPEDVATSIVVSNAGNVYVTGYSSLGTTFDYATIKYSSSGVEQWVQRFNGPENQNDFGSSIAIDAIENVYVTGSSYNTSTGTDYATIKYSQDDPLPVELTSFISSINQSDVKLTWSTASEISNSGFDVERSDVNSEWSKVNFVQGNGTTTSPKNYNFTDRNLTSGKYNYRLKQIDFNGNFEYFNLSNEVNIGIPDKFSLSQNYPNPFNPTTKISYNLPFDGKVSLKVFDVSGKEVMSLTNEIKIAGYYEEIINGSRLSSGVYFYRLTLEGNGNNFVSTKKMLMTK